MAAGNRGDGFIQGTLLSPTRAEFLGLRAGCLVSNDVSRALEEELTKCFSCILIHRGSIERCLHVLQPGAPFRSTNSETCMRFTQAQPPSGLGLLLIATQKLEEEGGKLLGGASKTLAREERTQNRVLAAPCVKFRRQPFTTRFTAERLQESGAHVRHRCSGERVEDRVDLV